MLLKLQKNNFWCVLNLLLLSSSLQWGKGYVPLWQLSLRILYQFDSIFSEILWIDKLHYLHEEICFSDNGYHGNRKKTIPQLSQQRLPRGRKALSKTPILQIQTTTAKIGLIGSKQGEMKYHNLKNLNF